ncbi:LysR family transcriptional regulator substrate-binding protein [Metabacillus sediminilitoris]|nr:LysR family transcriptional regulator substrate-binding protein [Metabacillus sediminilitoris]
MKREIILSQEKEKAFLTIGSWPSVATVYLPYHLAQNKRLKNRSEIKIKVSYSFFDLLNNLENRNIDAAVFNDSDVNHKFYSSPLIEEEFLLFVNRQHPKYGQKEEVSFDEMIEETFVMLAEGCDARMLVEKAFLEKGEKLNIALEIDFIEANLGISILPEIFINQLSDNIKAIPITNFKITRKISVIARKESDSKQKILIQSLKGKISMT